MSIKHLKALYLVWRRRRFITTEIFLRADLHGKIFVAFSTCKNPIINLFFYPPPPQKKKKKKKKRKLALALFSISLGTSSCLPGEIANNDYAKV